ncbi:T9SS type A sorting domain-containing protein [bacterium]|nr:T9SS type A sorting domain-containing protein [bacterium]
MNKKLTCLICCILLMVAATVQSATLLVHYKLDETSGTTVADATGNGFDGTIGGTVDFVAGTIDGAVQFWGAESITLPGEVMGMTSYMGSVAFWMKAPVPTSINTIFWGGDNTTGGGFGPENEMHMHLESAVTDIWNGGELSFYIRADPNPNVHLHSDPDKGGADAPGSVPVNPILMGDDVWHHVAGVWDGDAGTAMLFIDGILVMDWPYVPNIYDLTYIYLGQMANAGRTYNGLMDDFRLYSDVLTAEDVYYLNEKIEVDVEDRAERPLEFGLDQNYPNPFNPVTNIEFTLAKPGHTTLDIYNIQGQLVASLVDGQMSSGLHRVNFNADQYESGVYFYKLRSGDFSEMKKMMLVK